MSKIKIIPLGGMRETGKNMYLVEVGEKIFVLDGGLIYPEDAQFGVDAVIPDLTYLEKNAHKIAGVFLTHGHEDAIGAIPYFLDKFTVPVFGTQLTIELVKLNAKRVGVSINEEDLHYIDETTEIDFDDVSVQFFRTTHTIPDSVGIVIRTEWGNIVYTGDFKFEQTLKGLYATDYARLAEIGQQGVLALLSESINAEKYEENAAESEVYNEIVSVFRTNKNRIIATVVASNILRIQQVLNAAEVSGKKVFLADSHVRDIIDLTIELERLTLPSENLIQDIKKLDDFDDDKVVILQTGNEGEPFRSLNRMANGRHDQVNIKEGDLVYILTSYSADNEVQIANVVNRIYRAGGTVTDISNKFNASGHATPKELQLMINFMKPTYFIPVKGDYAMLAKHAELAHEVGLDYENIFIVGNGDVVSYEKDKMLATGQVESGDVLVDGSGIGDIGNIVLRDRRILSEDGVFIATITIDRRKKKVVSKPKIVTRGFVFVKESTELLEESGRIMQKTVEDFLKNEKFDWGNLKQEVRDDLNKFLFKKTNRRPIILPVIMEVHHNRQKKHKK